MIRAILLASLLVLTGCSDNIAGMSCSQVADEAIRASKGDLAAINNRSETSRNDKRLTCHGTGLLKDGEERPIRFEALMSDDGETFFKYDDDEHQAALAAQERMVERQEQAQDERQVQQTVDHAMEEGQREAEAATR